MVSVQAFTLCFSALIQSIRGGFRSDFLYVLYVLFDATSSALLVLLLAYHILQSASAITSHIIDTKFAIGSSYRCSNINNISAIEQTKIVCQQSLPLLLLYPMFLN